MEYPKVYLFGDSQTQRGWNVWIHHLADFFTRRCDFINRGFDGYNSNFCKFILPKLFNKENLLNCSAFFILLGSNDANKEKNERQHVSYEDYSSNLEQMIQKLEDLGLSRDKILLISPPPVDAEIWGEVLAQRDPPRELALDNSITALYAQSCIETAEKCKVGSVDLYTQMVKDQGWKKFVEGDGLHLSPAGGKFLANLVIPFLTERLPTEELYPNWKDVDYKHPENSL